MVKPLQTKERHIDKRGKVLFYDRATKFNKQKECL